MDELLATIATEVDMLDDAVLDALVLADDADRSRFYARLTAERGIAAHKVRNLRGVVNRRARAIAERAAELEAAAAATQPVALPAGAIVVNNRQLSALEDEALRALLRFNAATPTIYTRAGILVDVVDGRLRETPETFLRSTLGRAAHWVTDRGVDALVPLAPVSSIFSYGCWPEVPEVIGVTDVPIFAPDGTLHTEPGYNPATRFYLSGAVPVGEVSGDRLIWAKEQVDAILVDFPFETPADRTHAIALFLDPFVRLLAAGRAPGFAVDGSVPGAGKGLLVDVLLYPALGDRIESGTNRGDDAEWRKAITTTLLSGAPYFLVDNINHQMDSGVLASAMTQRWWTDRLLSTNRAVSLSNDLRFVVTGNNLQASAELARRFIRIRLSPNVPKPEERADFRIANLRAHVAEHRADLVTAALCIVQFWLDCGRPPFEGRRKGSFETWTEIMGGIWGLVGYAGFLENEQTFRSAVVKGGDSWQAFIEGWWQAFRDGEETVADDLYPLAGDDDDEGNYEGLLSEVLTWGKKRGRINQLGILLQQRADQVFEVKDGDGVERVQIRQAKRKAGKGTRQWRLAIVGKEYDDEKSGA